MRTFHKFHYFLVCLFVCLFVFEDKLGLKVSTSTPRDTKAIKLLKRDVSVPAKDGQQFPSPDESYSLEVDSSKELIAITGKGPAGVFYGVQTLLALRNSKGRVPKVSIKDAPRYSYRGLHLDVGRNFVAKDHVLKLLDTMAMYKLNKFHFHLTDDEGWRLEIPGFPELTEVKDKCAMKLLVAAYTFLHLGGRKGEGRRFKCILQSRV